MSNSRYVHVGPEVTMRLDRRFAQIVLGLLWLLDAGLQFQPFMFTREFATQVLAPNGDGQPGFVAVPVSWAVSLTSAQPVLAGVVFALVQLVIAVAILVPRTVRLGLALSIPWSAGVWLIGEGLGGLFAGHVDLLTGAPGAVVLYAVLAVAAWPRRSPSGWRSDVPLPYWLVPAWALMWLGFAVLTLVPGKDAVSSVTGQIDMMAAMTPGWLSTLDSRLSAWVGAAGMTGIIAFALLCVTIGLAALIRGPLRNAAAAAGIAVAVLAGLVGQAFGEIFSGQATDPNSAPLIILFACCALGASRMRSQDRRQRSAPPVDTAVATAMADHSPVLTPVP
ncbi:MAG: hypothetical protein ABI468_07100 [Candidatus Nanopelagicales bacterium]